MNKKSVKNKKNIFMAFVIFFVAVFAVYFAVNIYLFLKGLYSIPKDFVGKFLYALIFIFLSSSYILGRILDKTSPSSVSDILIYTGSLWLGLMLYLFLGSVLLDLLKFILLIFKIKPAFVYDNYENFKKISSLLIIFISLAMVGYGYYNAMNPTIKKLNITIPKSSSKYDKVNVVFVSDVHLGVILGDKFSKKLVEMINELNPDIVVFGGDLLDEDAEQVIRKNSAASLNNIRSRLGVYAVLGNHEYIGGVSKAENFYALHNIKLLVDEAYLIDNSFYLIGRDDKTSERFAKRKRKSLSEIVGSLDSSLPLILIDHQPFNLEISEKNRIDLQLSGHTHHGQLWPFNYITDLVYEVSWGYKRKNNFQIYVSSGFGTWGPPVRIGNKPEIVFIELSFLKGDI